ncbi:hypothetical protein ABKN59_005225 [Abortiporus biennis]
MPIASSRLAPIDYAFPYVKEADYRWYYLVLEGLRGVCDNFIFKSYAAQPDNTDVFVYCGSESVSEELEQDTTPEALLSFTDIPMEFKLLSDPFTSNAWENEAPSGYRGQLIAYVTNIFALQNRTHVFSVAVYGSKARFFRFDRAGAFVSDATDYVEDSHYFVDFFRRYNMLSRKQQGYDTSVTVATDVERSLYVDALNNFAQAAAQGVIRTSPAVDYTLTFNQFYRHVYKISISDISNSSTSLDYIFSAPFYHSASLYGRASKGFVAYSMNRRQLVFLKDTWRAVHPHIECEHEVYEDLISQMPELSSFLPTIYSAGDVSDPQPQSTTSTKWKNLEGISWVNGSPDVAPDEMKNHQHYRIAEELLYSIETIEDCEELWQITHDVNFVILMAWHKCQKRLHRDVSPGNVMTDGRGRGKLVDWDHSRKMSVGIPDSCHTERTGTWEFISYRLLSSPLEIHQLVDDMESMFWVFLDVALRFCSHGKLPIHFGYLFYGSPRVDQRLGGCIVGGQGKGSFFELRRDQISSLFNLKFFNTAFLEYTNLFKQLNLTLQIMRINASMEDQPEVGPSMDEYRRLENLICSEKSEVLEISQRFKAMLEHDNSKAQFFGVTEDQFPRHSGFSGSSDSEPTAANLPGVVPIRAA